MIECSYLFNKLNKSGIDFFAGVPDSLLKNFCSYVTDHTDSQNHIIAANEGGAIALASGYYLATNKYGLVYMQNSGQGNAANPLISLADPDVYSIPMLLLIGWRGQPGVKDEPQHVKQGKITLKFLETLNIPYKLLPETECDSEKVIDEIIDTMKKNEAPIALVATKNTFIPYESQNRMANKYKLERESAIKLVADAIEYSDIIVSTTGKISRELYEHRDSSGDNHSRDFLTVGSMGHASQIALGIAMNKKQRQVFILDGDGAAIMHMGAFAITGSKQPENLKHIILNNGCHDSVGGQHTAGFDIEFTNIAKACGYKVVLKADKSDDIIDKIKILRASKGPGLLEIRVTKGSRTSLGRPKIPPKENKNNFMGFLSN